MKKEEALTENWEVYPDLVAPALMEDSCSQGHRSPMGDGQEGTIHSSRCVWGTKKCGRARLERKEEEGQWRMEEGEGISKWCKRGEATEEVLRCVFNAMKNSQSFRLPVNLVSLAT